MKIKDIKKGTKKVIKHILEKLIQKYGLEKVRLICNKFFLDLKEKSNLQKEIETRERELAKLKKEQF